MGSAGGLIGSARAAEIGREGAAHAATLAARFDLQLSAALAGLLAGFTERDRGLVAETLHEVKRLLDRLNPGVVDLLFGGSVAKRTYVEGISDVDCLLLFGDEAAHRAPSDLMREVAEALSGMPCEVRTGVMAITLRYMEGAEVQLLPAVRSGDARLLVAGGGGARWRDVGPQDFAGTLREVDRRCGHKLVPVIKLTKAALASIHPDRRPSGHHVESLAVEAFRDYPGPMVTTSMLQWFLRRASTAVLRPVRDASGQTALVDAGLGPANGAARRRLSREIERLWHAMKIASRDGSTAAWLALFGNPT